MVEPLLTVAVELVRVLGSCPIAAEWDVSGSEVTSGSAADVGSESTSEPATSNAPAESSFDGPPAPDFELALSDGSVFKLSDEQKPIYVIFWAEW